MAVLKSLHGYSNPQMSGFRAPLHYRGRDVPGRLLADGARRGAGGQGHDHPHQPPGAPHLPSSSSYSSSSN